MEASSAKWPSLCIGLSVLQINHTIIVADDTGPFYPLCDVVITATTHLATSVLVGSIHNARFDQGLTSRNRQSSLLYVPQTALSNIGYPILIYIYIYLLYILTYTYQQKSTWSRKIQKFVEKLSSAK